MTTVKEQKKIPPLLYPPLVEAIFEVRWELQVDPETKRYRDPSYPMMYGRVYERMKKDFPFLEDLPATQMHPEASPYMVRHRIRRDKASYPLMQIGPGIATINIAKEYSWTDFKVAIMRLVDALIDLFPVGTIPLNFIKAEMRYLNAIPFDAAKENPVTFMKEKLHIGIDLDPEILELNHAVATPNLLNFNIAHQLNRPVGNLVLTSSLGQMDGKPAFLLQTVIDSLGETVPNDEESFKEWLENAHSVARNCFATLCKGELIDQFGGKA